MNTYNTFCIVCIKRFSGEKSFPELETLLKSRERNTQRIMNHYLIIYMHREISTLTTNTFILLSTYVYVWIYTTTV